MYSPMNEMTSNQRRLLAQVAKLDSQEPLTVDDIPEAAAMRLHTNITLGQQDRDRVAQLLSLLRKAKEDSGCSRIFTKNDLSAKVIKLFKDKDYKIEAADREGSEICISW